VSSRIRAEDIESRPIARRTFLGRFTAAGVVGLVGFTAACEPTDSCDGDQGGDPIQSDDDGTDSVTFDQDSGDPCDSDGVSF
jgi:hypothetical protein